MHEMGIALQIIDIAKESIPDSLKETPVEFVNINVGKLSAVIPDNLKFCFSVVAKDTQFEGAELNITELPVVAVCLNCNNRWTVDNPVFSCPNCSGGKLDLVSGQELDIVSIELKET